MASDDATIKVDDNLSIKVETDDNLAVLILTDDNV